MNYQEAKIKAGKLIKKFNERGLEVCSYIKNKRYFWFEKAVLKDEGKDVEGKESFFIEIPIPRINNDGEEDEADFIAFSEYMSEEEIDMSITNLKAAIYIYINKLNDIVDNLRVKFVGDTKYLVGRKLQNCQKVCPMACKGVCGMNNKDLKYRNSESKCRTFISALEAFVRVADFDEGVFLSKIIR